VNWISNLGLASFVVFGVAGETSIAEPWLSGGALTVLGGVVLIFVLKVFPSLIQQLADQSKAFAESTERSAVAQAAAMDKLANAFSALSITCARVHDLDKN
jgi:hypothetical protein